MIYYQENYWYRNFWNKVDVRGPDECWNWTGGPVGSGYGGFHYLFWKMRAHRMAYLLHHGELDDDSLVLHTCDNRLCCNPKHLVQGSQKDNMKHMDSKGRRNTHTHLGENHYNARLNEEAVKVIKWMGKNRPDITQEKLANLYGVTQQTVSRIINGKKWSYVKA